MSQSGAVTFYSIEAAEAPQSLLRAVLDVAKPRHLSSVYRSLVEDRGFEDAQNDGSGIPQEQVEKGPFVDPSRMPGHYRQGRSLSAELVGSPMADRMWDAVLNGIPEDVRGKYGFCPDSMFVTLGHHDVFEWSEHEDRYRHVARPFLSIRFWGQRSPDDWEGFRQRVFQLPEVRALKTELETVTGPLQEWVSWST